MPVTFLPFALCRTLGGNIFFHFQPKSRCHFFFVLGRDYVLLFNPAKGLKTRESPPGLVGAWFVALAARLSYFFSSLETVDPLTSFPSLFSKLNF